MQLLVSSLSAGDCLVHQLRKKLKIQFPRYKKYFFLTSAQDSHLQTVTIPEAAHTQLRRRPPEDKQGNARNM
jgi:hypothetical protein